MTAPTYHFPSLGILYKTCRGIKSVHDVAVRIFCYVKKLPCFYPKYRKYFP